MESLNKRNHAQAGQAYMASTKRAASQNFHQTYLSAAQSQQTGHAGVAGCSDMDSLVKCI